MSQMANKLAAKGVAAMAAALEAGASKDEAAAAGAAAMLAAAQGVVFFSPQGAASTIVEEVAAPVAAEAPRAPVGEQPHEAGGAERALLRLAASMGMALAAQPLMISTSTTKLWLMSCWR